MRSLVVFVGPPSSNKTTYFHKHYSSTHERISIEEWKKQSPDLTLHTIFKRIIRKLNAAKPNTGVVIDDENNVKQTRESLVSKVKSSVTDCQVTCVWFQVSSVIQCLWQKEMNIAARDYAIQRKGDKDNGSVTELAISKLKLNYFSGSISIDEKWKPQRKEFDELKIVQVDSVCVPLRNLTHFNHHALFIDAHCFLQLSTHSTIPQTMACKSGTQYIFESWMKSRKNARIIIIIDQKRLLHLLGISDQSAANCKEATKLVRRSIGIMKLTYPVYYIYHNMQKTEENVPVFFMPPNAGMIAYCQYVHSLDLKQSIYISEPTPDYGTRKANPSIKNEFSTSDLSISDSIGLSICQFSKLSIIPSEEVHFNQHLAKHLLQSNSIVSFIFNLEAVDWTLTPSETLKEIERYPLLRRQKATDLYCAEKSESNGRTMGIVLAVNLVDKYLEQNSFVEAQGLYEELEAHKDYKKRNGKLFTSSPQPQSVRTKPMSSAEPDSTQITSTPQKAVTEVKILNTKSELVDLFGIDAFERGSQLLTDKKMYELRTKVVKEQYFKMYSKCNGVDNAVYRQESLFKDQKVMKSVCTCPGGRKGQCKHVIGAILAYQEQCKLTEAMAAVKAEPSECTTPVKTVPTGEAQVESASKRSLPAWMTGEVKSKPPTKKKDSDSEPTTKKTKTPFFLFRDDYYEEVKKELNTNSVTAISKVLGERWRSLPVEAEDGLKSKAYYKRKFEQLKQQADGDEKPKRTVKSESAPASSTVIIVKKEEKKPDQWKPQKLMESDDDDTDVEEEEGVSSSLEITSSYVMPKDKKTTFDDIFFPAVNPKPKVADQDSVPVPVSTNLFEDNRKDNLDEGFEDIFFSSKPKAKPPITEAPKPQKAEVTEDSSDIDNLFFGGPSRAIDKKQKAPESVPDIPKPAAPQKLDKMTDDADDDVANIFFSSAPPRSISKKAPQPEPVRTLPNKQNDADTDDIENIFFSSTKPQAPVSSNSLRASEQVKRFEEKLQASRPDPPLESTPSDFTSIFFSSSKPVVTQVKPVEKPTTVSSSRPKSPDDLDSLFFGSAARKEPQIPAKQISTTSKPQATKAEDKEDDFADIFFGGSAKTNPPPKRKTPDSPTPDPPAKKLKTEPAPSTSTDSFSAVDSQRSNNSSSQGGDSQPKKKSLKEMMKNFRMKLA